MIPTSSSTNADRHAEYSKSKLFLVSVLALATAGIGFSIRGDIGGALQSHFFDPIDKLHSAEMTASVLGIVFMGFAIAIAIGSPLLDYLGMGRLLGVSSLCFVIGNLVVIFADNLKGSLPVFWVVWTGMLIIGVAQGLVETVINPLAATLYPDDKTHKLNVLHAWWPGGIIIGGLISLGLGYLNLGWQAKLAVVLLPAVSFGAMIIGTKFPPTERVAAGISATAMFKELGRPLFIIFWLSMFLTAAADGGNERDHLAGVCQRLDVCDAAFCRAAGAQTFPDWRPVGLLSPRFGGTAAAQRRQFSRHRLAGRHGLGHRCLLHVADDAGVGFGTVPAGRRFVDRVDGHRGQPVDQIRPAVDGEHFRQNQDPGGGRRRGFQGADGRKAE